MAHTPDARRSAVQRIQRRIQEHSFPRLQMTVMVIITGGAGLLCSFCLLHLGLTSMTLRYPLAVGLAFLAFLGMLWLWVHDAAAGGLDLLGQVLGPPGGGDAGPSVPGDALGATHDAAVASLDASVGSGAADGTTAAADVAAATLHGDILAVPLLALALALGSVFAAVYVIHSAPALFAELVIDGALSIGLYRRLRGSEPRHWLRAALRRTALPFVLTAVLACLVGVGLSIAAPGAKTLGEALRHRSAPQLGQ